MKSEKLNNGKRNQTRRFFLTAAATVAATLGALNAANAQSAGVPWTAIDDLERVVAGPDATPDVREKKTVGIFYFLWMDPTTMIPSDPNRAKDDVGPYDLTKILEKDPEAVRRQDDSLLGTNGQMHFWGEPLFGYYDSRDPWVIRRHMQMISDAGIDVLIFDTTNAVTYPHVYIPVCDVLLEMKAEGAAVPQVTFMTNTRVDYTTQKLWDEFYSQEKYASLFFHWEGKPFLLSNPAEVPEALRDKFTFRTAYWPTFGMKNTQDAWHWVAAYPQPYSWTKDAETPEQVNVSTAQNLARDKNGLPVWMSQETARGRSFVWGDEKKSPTGAPNDGLNFAQQWERAYELDPPFVMITGWNEWIAGRWKQGDIYIFVDQFNQEFSRDVEPTRGLHFDNYYLQMVDGIRKYKGTPRLPQTASTKTIAGFEDWAAVEPTFRDYINETLPRDFVGVGGTAYKNDTGRNDIVAAKIARDAEKVYFYVETREPIQNPARPDGLCLAINVDGDLKTGWRGADMLIGRKYAEDGTVVAERFNDAAQPKPNGDVPWRTKKRQNGVRWTLDGNKLQLTVPVSLLKDGGENATISFKWLDNLKFESFAELYERGDVAPESSFFYRADFQR